MRELRDDGKNHIMSALIFILH